MRKWLVPTWQGRSRLAVVIGVAVAGILGLLAVTSGMLSSGDARSIPPVDRIGVAETIRTIDITVIDGKTIRARGRTMSLMGFDAPEAGSRAQCARERELGARATAQLQTLVAGGGLELRRVPCACPPGTEGTPNCNQGQSCAQLRSYGRDIAGMMIQYVVARPRVCSAISCLPRRSWCGTERPS